MTMDDLVSPFDETVVDPQPPAPRLGSVEGKRITLMSISKPKSAEFLAELERVLRDDYNAIVKQAQKPTFTKPAPQQIIEEVLASSDAVVEALAD